jgi:hypothetical protein
MLETSKIFNHTKLEDPIKRMALAMLPPQQFVHYRDGGLHSRSVSVYKFYKQTDRHTQLAVK